MSHGQTPGSWSISPPSANALLRLYRAGDGAFVSPTCSLLTRGVYRHLDATSLQTLPAQATQLLRTIADEGEAEPLLVGAIGFDERTPPKLFVPDGVVMGAGATPDQRTVGGPPATAILLPDPVPGLSLPAQARYCANVDKALQEIEDGHLDKVVLSRARKVEAQVDVARLVQRLMPRNLMGYTYAVNLQDSTSPKHARTLVGASPELLLCKRGRHVASHPLAGSVPRATDASEDRLRAARLLESSKDLREHAYVVEAVARVLAPYCRTLIVPPAPSLVSTPTMWHLGTRIVGELKDDEATALELALALHPTPAVCGHPSAAAAAFIRQHEGFDRDYFAGLVGWTDLRGDGEWAVTIRCAEVGSQHATLYAGAGIVSGSSPQSELAETEAKMATMWNAMATALIREAA